MVQTGRIRGRGTSLFAVTTEDGIVMAADDLIYVEQAGEAIPTFQDVQKVFVASDNILIGSAGVMLHAGAKYKFDNWVAAIVARHAGESAKLPSEIAAALEAEAKLTFTADHVAESSFWGNRPGGRIVTYLIAGYGHDFHQPYVFDLWADIHEQEGLRFSLVPKSEPKVRVGEDQFMSRIWRGGEPQFSLWSEGLPGLQDRCADLLPEVPDSLQAAVASTAGYIKIESQFNPKKVGNRVRVGVIVRETRKAYAIWL